MINAILKGLFSLLIDLIDLVSAPIDTIIGAVFPQISTALSYVGNMFVYLSNFLGYILSWFHLPNGLITLIIGYSVFRLTVPFAVHSIKLAVKWYHYLMP